MTLAHTPEKIADLAPIKRQYSHTEVPFFTYLIGKEPSLKPRDLGWVVGELVFSPAFLGEGPWPASAEGELTTSINIITHMSPDPAMRSRDLSPNLPCPHQNDRCTSHRAALCSLHVITKA